MYPVSMLVACQLLLVMVVAAVKPRWYTAHRSAVNFLSRMFRRVSAFTACPFA